MERKEGKEQRGKGIGYCIDALHGVLEWVRGWILHLVPREVSAVTT